VKKVIKKWYGNDEQPLISNEEYTYAVLDPSGKTPEYRVCAVKVGKLQ